VFLFLHDNEDNLYVLYPSTSSRRTAMRGDSVSVFIPEGLEWFEFEEGSGTERFYLFTSVQRLDELEECVRDYEKAASSRKRNEGSFQEAKRKALECIRRLQVENYELVKGAKEDIVLAAGEFRGLEEYFEFPACKVEFTGFYARTIRISH
jgi:hypothetical protein